MLEQKSLTTSGAIPVLEKAFFVFGVQLSLKVTSTVYEAILGSVLDTLFTAYINEQKHGVRVR